MATYTIKQDGSGDFTTLTDFLAAAHDNDIASVYTGAYDEVPATGDTYDGLGDWAMPRHDSMVDALREAHADRLECVRRGMAGAERAREFTWERSAWELVPVLEGAA